MDYRENDVYRWNYTVAQIEKLDNGSYRDFYWCKSQICIFDGEKFEDTYWGRGSENKTFTPKEIGTKIELKFLGNIDDYTKQNYGNYQFFTQYYSPEDILDLTHPNSFGAQIYLKNGAAKNVEIMRAAAQSKIEEMERQLKNLTDDIRIDKQRLEELNEENKGSFWMRVIKM